MTHSALSPIIFASWKVLMLNVELEDGGVIYIHLAACGLQLKLFRKNAV
jgi:hypothetical protein